jgi:hypothetical protein
LSPNQAKGRNKTRDLSPRRAQSAAEETRAHDVLVSSAILRVLCGERSLVFSSTDPFALKMHPLDQEKTQRKKEKKKKDICCSSAFSALKNASFNAKPNPTL